MGITGEPLRFKTLRLLVSGRDPSEKTLVDNLNDLLTPAVLAHLPSDMQDVTTPGEWIDAQRAESDVLFVLRKSDQKLLGLVLLARIEGDIHLGYLLAETAWGQGYATELVRGLLPVLAAGSADRVVGGVGRDNPASARVLEKAGFRKDDGASTEDTVQYVCHLNGG